MSASPPPTSPASLESSPNSPEHSLPPLPTTPPPMPSPQELYESALRELEDATRDLETCLPSYSPPAVVVLREADVRGIVEGQNQLANAATPAQQGNKASLPAPTLESLLVSRGRHKPSPANRAVAYVRRLAPLARVAGLGDSSESLSAPSLVAALNALALIFAVTTRQDDALDQLEKIAYQASRSPASPALTPSSSPQTSRIRNASISTPSSPISPSHQHNNFFGAAPESDAVLTLRTPAVQLLCAVVGFLKGALRRAGPPGTLRGRAPLGGAQAYAAAKGKLNVGVAGWDRGIRGWEGDE